MAGEVFISYRKEDKPSADRICSALERENIKCWIAPRDVPVGREWAASIVEALKACSSFVMVLSSNSKNAKQIAREAELADNAGVPIITVRLEDVQPPPQLQYFLGNIQWLDAFGGEFEPAMHRLADVVRQNARPETLAASASAGSASSAIRPLAQQYDAGPAPSSPAASAAPSSSSASPRRLSPVVLASTLAVVIALGVLIWWMTRPSPAPNPRPDLNGAAAFGIEYMQRRDSGQTKLAYSMTGSAFQKRVSYDDFAAKVAKLSGRGSAQNYEPDGTCTERERGAYSCKYLVSYSDGKSKKEALTIAQKKNGNWAIAGDNSLGSE